MDKIIKKYNLKHNQYYNYNNEFLKINDINNEKQGKLIVVTSINPTPKGEGKTTLLIGLVDALNAHNIDAIGCLRQPSLGPVFGLKGTATGGGKSRLVNDEKININFTGDFYAIMSANNLISSVIDNEIYFNSSLNIDPKKIIWKRCIDLNDRSLRDLEMKINSEKSYKTGFNITAASDLMALFCLVNNRQEFIEKLNNTIIAYSLDDKAIRIKDLEIIDAIMSIIDHSLKPNLAKTIYDSPILIHGGPFANIAHGCNSIIATKTALKMSDYVITECGFGSDLGFEKFMNIKMQEANMKPNLVVVCATIKALKYHGNNDNLDDISSLKNGFKNLLAHVNHIRNYNLEPLVVLNVNDIDTKQEINEFEQLCVQNNIQFELSDIYNNGPEKNTEKLTNTIIKLSNKKCDVKYLYDVKKDTLEQKLNAITQNVYKTDEIIINDKIKHLFSSNQFQDYYLCIAKTPYSLSSDPNKINIPEHNQLIINDYEINHAAKMVVLICDKVFRMPGLNKEPRAKNFKFK